MPQNLLSSDFRLFRRLAAWRKVPGPRAVAVLVIVVSYVVAVVLVPSFSGPYSSASDWRGDQFGLSKETLQLRRTPEGMLGRDPAEPFPSVRLRASDETGFVIEKLGQDSAGMVPLASPWLSDVNVNLGNNMVEVDGIGQIEFVAFSVVYPGRVQGSDGSLVLRSPLSGQALSQTALDALGVPDDFRKRDLQESSFPKLNLILKCPDSAALALSNFWLFDLRTGMKIDRQGNTIEKASHWYKVESELSIWHFPGYLLGMEVLSGEPIQNRFLPRTNEQVQVQGYFRLGVLYACDGNAISGGIGESFDWRKFRKIPGSDGASLFLFQIPEPFVDQLAFDFPDEGRSIYEVFAARERPGAVFENEPIQKFKVDCRKGKLDRNREIRVTFFPHRTRIWFQVPSALDVPNAFEGGNLFGVKMSKVSPKDADPLSLVADATELKLRRGVSVRSNLDAVYEITPEELLKRLVEENPSLRYRVDGDSMSLEFYYSESITDRIGRWIRMVKGR